MLCDRRAPQQRPWHRCVRLANSSTSVVMITKARDLCSAKRGGTAATRHHASHGFCFVSYHASARTALGRSGRLPIAWLFRGGSEYLFCWKTQRPRRDQEGLSPISPLAAIRFLLSFFIIHVRAHGVRHPCPVIVACPRDCPTAFSEQKAFECSEERLLLSTPNNLPLTEIRSTLGERRPRIEYEDHLGMILFDRRCSGKVINLTTVQTDDQIEYYLSEGSKEQHLENNLLFCTDNTIIMLILSLVCGLAVSHGCSFSRVACLKVHFKGPSVGLGSVWGGEFPTNSLSNIIALTQIGER